MSSDAASPEKLSATVSCRVAATSRSGPVSAPDLAAVAAGLEANGVAYTIEGDDLIVAGTGSAARGGGTVPTHMDHRIAMSFLVMGLASDLPVTVDDTVFIATSFPDFVPMIRRLGGELG